MAAAGVSRNVVKIDERSIFCPKDRQFFRTLGQTSTMDRVFLAFERYVNFSIALGNAAIATLMYMTYEI